MESMRETQAITTTYHFCTGCTDTVIVTTEAPDRIAGEVYCKPCYEAYRLDGVVHE